MRHVCTISSTEASTCDDTLVEAELPFYDAINDDDRSYLFSSDTFACRIDRDVLETKRYVNPMDCLPIKSKMGLSDAGLEKELFGKAFHLTIDMEKWNDVNVPFIRQSDVDSFIDELTYEEIIGFDPKNNETNNDSFVFALKAIHRFKKLDLELTSEYLEYRPL
jgi:hypothetical protein